MRYFYADMYIIMLIYLISGTLIQQSAGRDCGVGWISVLERCYHFSRDVDNWANAVVNCKVLNAKLAELESAKEETYLRQYMEDNIDHSLQIWLGCTDELQEKYWVWISNNAVITNSDWWPGEPNNFGNNENCLEVIGSFNFRWFNDNCHKQKRYICEK